MPILTGPVPSLADAALLADCCRLAYLAQDAATTDAIRALGFDQVEFLSVERTSTQTFVATTASAVAVVFRGTEPTGLVDWMTDARCRLVAEPAGRGRVHQGFSAALASITPVLDPLVERLRVGSGRDPSKTVWITGHSLGGALAMLYAAHAVAPLRPTTVSWRPQAVITFGMPGAGDGAFVQAYDAAPGALGTLGTCTWRFVNDDDVVPTVPPIGWGYRHGGTLYQIDDRGRLGHRQGWWRWLHQTARGWWSDWNQLLRGKPGSPIPHAIVSHDPPQYVARLARLAAEVRS